MLIAYWTFQTEPGNFVGMIHPNERCYDFLLPCLLPSDCIWLVPGTWED